MAAYNKKKYLYSIMICLIAVGFLFLSGKTVNAATEGFRTINGKHYYIKKNGCKHTGWLNLNGKKYYFLKSTGEQVIGWQTKKNGYRLRYFRAKPGADGYMVTGLWKTTKGNTYYFNPKDGLMVRGWNYENGNHRFFDRDTGIMYQGVKKVDKFYYYFKGSKGYRCKDGFTTVGNNTYYFSPTDGRAKVGWMTLNGKKYYFDSKTGVMYKGIRKIGKYYYYFQGSQGIMFNGGFRVFTDKTYYFNPKDGHGHIGWLTLNGNKYYFNKKGIMYQDTTLSLGGKKYTVDEQGIVKEYTVKYTMENGKVKVYDSKYKKYFLLAPEYIEHNGVANRAKSDLDVLAALCESEAGDQGKIGMEAVALCILNRTIDKNKEFPSDIRYVIYHQGSYSFPQYSVVRNGVLEKRMNGEFTNKTLAYAAAKEAMTIFNKYVKTGEPRTLKGFKKDFDYRYFMMEYSYWKQPLDFDRVESFLYKDHMFFVDWVSPK